MSKLVFKAEMYKKFIDVSLAHFNVEISDDQKFAICHQLVGFNQYHYDKHLETLPKVYFNEPGFEMAMDANPLGTDRVCVQSNNPHGDTHTARLDAMEKLK